MDQDQKEADWWRGWWGRDFSWEGLAQHDLRDQGGTLQDYWREEESQLIEGPEGRHYTRFHLPLQWRDGTPTEKASWTRKQHDTLAKALGDRLARAYADGSRARFDGVVLQQVPKMPEAPGDGQKPGPTVFNHAWLQPGTTWESEVFASDAWFGDAQFVGGAGFRGARFAGAALFAGAQFAGEAGFASAKFAGAAMFDGAQFAVYASFGSAQFAGGASFDGAQFAGSARFDRAQFAGRGSFHSALFAGRASFDSAQFAGGASFDGAQFAGSARFDRAQFAGQAQFLGTQFAFYASFDSAQFAGSATFDDARFGGLVSFPSVQFAGTTFFRNTVFPEHPDDFVGAFYNAEFLKNADFSICESFNENPAFEGRPFKAFAAFDGAILKSEIRLSDEVVRDNRHLHSAIEMIRSPANISSVQKREIEPHDRREEPTTEEMRDFRREYIDNRLEQNLKSLENGARVLKLAYESARDRINEQQLYRLEILARRAQKRTPPFFKFMTDVYGWTADYGRSMGQPLASVFWVGVLFAFVFAALPAAAMSLGEGALTFPDDGFWGPVLFSARNIFAPFAAWRVDPEMARGFEAVLLAPPGLAGPAWELLIKLLATFQSFFSVVMLFLTGLAARRYFQLN